MLDRCYVVIHLLDDYAGETNRLIEEDRMSSQTMQGVFFNTKVSKITLVKVPDKPGIAADLFGVLGAKNIDVELVVNTSVEPGLADVAFVVSESYVPAVQESMKDFLQKLGGEDILVDHEVATLAIRSSESSEKVTPREMFGALATAGINIEMISSSLWGITCVIRQNRLEDAMNAIKEINQ